MDQIFNDAVRRMAERRSVRSFSDKHIPDEVLDQILQAGLNAASGGNLQPFSILEERDRERNQALGKMLKYPFVENADVNLIFLLDWYKLARYSRCRQAPFIEDRSMSHFFIAWDDTVISAQAVETAAWLCGIGTCFIGHVMDCSEELRMMYDLPEMTFPVLLLSMGYPKVIPPKPAKLHKDLMVFKGKYPKLSDEEICKVFDAKYAGRKLPVSAVGKASQERIDAFLRALRTSYSEQDSKRILADTIERGYLTEIQRLFGIHYHPDRELGDFLTAALNAQGLYPFTSSEKEQQ